MQTKPEDYIQQLYRQKQHLLTSLMDDHRVYLVKYETQKEMLTKELDDLRRYIDTNIKKDDKK